MLMNGDLKVFAQIQEKLMNITNDNYEKIKTKITKNSYWSLKKNYDSLVRCFINALTYRPSETSIIINLFIELFSFFKLNGRLDSFKTSVIEAIFELPGPNSACVFLLYKLFANNIFNDIEIINRIRLYKYQNAEMKDNLMTLFLWFCPEIYDNNLHFFHMLRNDLVSSFNQKQQRMVPIDIFENNLPMSRKEFKLIKMLRENGHNHYAIILDFIKNDEEDYFQKEASNPNFNFSQEITPSYFEICPLLQDYPSLLEVAALFGSVKSFKYFLINEESQGEGMTSKLRLAKYAFAGGNIEIIRLCLQKNFPLNGVLQVVGLFHRNNLLDWLIDTQGHDPYVCSDTEGTIIQNAASSNNLYAIEKCINLDVNANKGARNKTPLQEACEKNNIESVNLLLTNQNIDLNSCVSFSNIKSFSYM